MDAQFIKQLNAWRHIEWPPRLPQPKDLKAIKEMAKQSYFRFEAESSDYWDFGASQVFRLSLIPGREYKLRRKEMLAAKKKAEQLLEQVENLRRPKPQYYQDHKEVESKEADELEKQAGVAEKVYIRLLNDLCGTRDLSGVGGLCIKERLTSSGDGAELFEDDDDMVPCDDESIQFGIRYIQIVNVSHDDDEFEKYMIDWQPQDRFYNLGTLTWKEFEKLRNQPWVNPFKPKLE